MNSTVLFNTLSSIADYNLVPMIHDKQFCLHKPKQKSHVNQVVPCIMHSSCKWEKIKESKSMARCTWPEQQEYTNQYKSHQFNHSRGACNSYKTIRITTENLSIRTDKTFLEQLTTWGIVFEHADIVVRIQFAFSPAEARIVRGPAQVGKHLKMTKCFFKAKLPTKICFQTAHVVVLMFQ